MTVNDAPLSCQNLVCRQTRDRSNAPYHHFSIHSRRGERPVRSKLSYIKVRYKIVTNTSSIRSTTGKSFSSYAIATHAVIRDLTKEMLHCRFELASHVRWSIRSACTLEGRGESP